MATTAEHIFATFYVNSFLLIVESHKIKSYRQFIGKSSHNSKIHNNNRDYGNLCLNLDGDND